MSYTRPEYSSADATWEGKPSYTRPSASSNVYFCPDVVGAGLGQPSPAPLVIGGAHQFGFGQEEPVYLGWAVGGLGNYGVALGSKSIFVYRCQGTGGSPVSGDGYGPEEATLPWGYAQNLFEGWGLGTQELVGRGEGTSPGGGFVTGSGESTGEGVGFCPPGGVGLGSWLEHGEPKGIFGQAGFGTGAEIMPLGSGSGGIGPYRGACLGAYPINPEGYGGSAPSLAAGLGTQFYIATGAGHLHKELTYPYFLFPGYSSDGVSITIPISVLRNMTAEKADAVTGDWRELAQSVLLCVKEYLDLRNSQTKLNTVSVKCTNAIVNDAVFGMALKRDFSYSTTIDLPIANVTTEPE